jgi:hypothetical protein
MITAVGCGCANAFAAPSLERRRALSDYELLEMMLFRALPRGDVKQLAKSLRLVRRGTAPLKT